MYKEVSLSCLPERLVVSAPACMASSPRAFDICAQAKHVQWHMLSPGRVRLSLFLTNIKMLINY